MAKFDQDAKITFTESLLKNQAVNGDELELADATRSTSVNNDNKINLRFEAILEYVKPFGKFQILMFLLLLPPTMTSYVLTSVYTTQDVPHFCRVPAVWNESTGCYSSWTLEEKRNFSIPSKPSTEAPAIGQTYQPCKYYDLPYIEYGNMNFGDAVRKRNEFVARQRDNDSYVKNCGSTIDAWVYDFTTKDFKDSIQVHWNLVCEREALIPISRTAYFFGFVIGLGVGGIASDRLGRRPTILVSGALTIIFGLLTALPRNYIEHIIVQALVAASCNAFVCAGSVLCTVMESTNARYRTSLNFVYMMPFELTFAYISLMAWLGQNWRFLQLSINFVLVPCLLYPCLLTESPRWLIQRQRWAEATKILRRAAKLNGRQHKLPTNFDEQVRQVARLHSGSSNAAETRGGKSDDGCCKHLMRLFQTRKMRVRTLGTCALTFTHELVWFGLTWYAAELEGTNQFLIFSLQGLIALPSMLVALALYHYYGGRRLMMGFLALSSACLLSVAFIDIYGALTRLAVPVLILATLGKSFNDGSYSSLCVYTLEVFPTLHRNSGFNLSSMVARIASALSPFTQTLADNVWHPMPLLIFGSLSAACFLLLWLVMPDVYRKPLDETADEVE